MKEESSSKTYVRGPMYIGIGHHHHHDDGKDDNSTDSGGGDGGGWWWRYEEAFALLEI